MWTNGLMFKIPSSRKRFEKMAGEFGFIIGY